MSQRIVIDPFLEFLNIGIFVDFMVVGNECIDIERSLEKLAVTDCIFSKLFVLSWKLYEVFVCQESRIFI